MNEKRLFLAADSGGSKTVWILLNEFGDVLSKIQTIGMGAASDGALPVEQTVSEAHSKISTPQDPCSVFLSLGGANTAEVKAALERLWPNTKVSVEREASGDAILYAAKYMNCDAVVMCGTGSVAVGNTSSGRKYRGGWGPIYGDGGSGGGMGADALRTFLHSIDTGDDIGEIATLFQNLTVGLNAEAFADRMKIKSRALNMTRRELASLAPKIYALAERCDKTALELYDNAAHAITELALGVSENSEDFNVLLCGGFFSNKPMLLDACRKYCSLKSRAILKYDPRFSPSIAAQVAALNRGGIEITPELFEKLLNN